MLQGTPNERYLDRFVHDLRERYAPGHIEAWSDAELRAARRGVGVEVALFAGSFPDDDSWRGESPDGDVDADGNDLAGDKRPLSAFERQRLTRVEAEARLTIDRLVGDEDGNGLLGRLRRVVAALRGLAGR